MIKQVSVVFCLYCLCPTELMPSGMFAKFLDHVLLFLCHKIIWKCIEGFHTLEKTPYSQLYEFSLWKEAWFFHLFWVKRFGNVFPFLLCQYDTVGKYWTAEVSEWMEKSAQDCFVIIVCLISTLKKNEKSNLLWFYENLNNSFRNSIALCYAFHRIFARSILENVATSAQANMKSLANHFFQGNLTDSTCQMILLCNVKRKWSVYS